MINYHYYMRLQRNNMTKLSSFHVIEVLLFLVLIATEILASYNNDEFYEQITRIKGNITKKENDHGYAVAILYGQNQISKICDGSIISAFFILTACHCIFDLNMKNYKIRAGSRYWDRDGNIHDVSSFACDPRAEMIDSLMIYDVAVMSVSMSFQLDQNEYLSSLDLWFPYNENFRHQASGFSWGGYKYTWKNNPVNDPYHYNSIGFDYNDNLSSSRRLKPLLFDRINPKDCKIYLQSIIKSTHIPKQMCLKSTSRKINKGFSGSAVLVNGQLAGISSYGINMHSNIAVYTDVSLAADWIMDFEFESTNVFEKAINRKASASRLSEAEVKSSLGFAEGKIEDAPHVVAILYNGWFLCSGSIKSASHVISAAHCFKNRLIENMTIRAGSSYWHMGGSLHNVSKIIYHPNADIRSSGSIYDVAVVEIIDEFQFDYKTREPIDLYSHFDFNEIVYPNMSALVAGWEAYDLIYNNETSKGLVPKLRLQNIDVIVEDISLCYRSQKARFAFLRQFSQNLSLLCTRPDLRSDGSYGDSGSGLVIDGKLAGVLSYSYGTLKNRIHLHTAISSVSKWIQWITNSEENENLSSFVEELHYDLKIVNTQAIYEAAYKYAEPYYAKKRQSPLPKFT